MIDRQRPVETAGTWSGQRKSRLDVGERQKRVGVSATGRNVSASGRVGVSAFLKVTFVPRSFARRSMGVPARSKPGGLA
jgi:hypothetical protein